MFRIFTLNLEFSFDFKSGLLLTLLTKMFFNYRKIVRRASVRRNPLTNMRALMKLNPYSAVMKKNASKIDAARKKQRDAALAKKRGVIDLF